MSAYAIQPESSAMKYNECPNCGTRWTPPELGCPKCQDAATPAPTPRTDAERHKTHACYDAVTADFARTLERELTSAQAALAAKDAEIAELKDKVVSAAWEYGKQKTRAEKAEAELAQTQQVAAERAKERLEWNAENRRERDALRAEVERLNGVKNQLERTGFVTITQLADAWLDHQNTFKSQTAYVDEVEKRESQLRAEVENIKAWANSKADEAQELRAALAAAQEDTERLELLAVNAAEVRVEWDDGEGPIPPEFSIVAKGTGVIGRGPTLRAAIDAARKAQSPC